MDSLTNMAATLRRYPSSFVDVIGHTDSTGSAEYNQRLSERRAQAVADVLLARGVKSERVVAYGYGLTKPVATNDTAEGRAANRRVEIKITPLTES
jgi:outer membrane protein OmpA-like peptidoglycan-associated protein